jgi:uncharacterized protein (TIGR01777 family)
LTASLVQQGHTCHALRRQTGATQTGTWDPAKGTIRLDADADYDAVVHLAGESIATGRWTAAKKTKIRESRVLGTHLLSETLAGQASKPKVLVSASAIGFYGDQGEQVLDETALPGGGFLSEVCQAWEAATQPAEQAGIRVVHARLGVVLSLAGGALKAMLPPFKMGLGGRIGSGRQYMSWIALEDVVAALQFLITQSSLSGPVNVVAPHAVTNEEFTKALGRSLHRPTLFPMPAFVAHLALGEMADALLLASTRVLPQKLLSAGHTFQLPELPSALGGILQRS